MSANFDDSDDSSEGDSGGSGSDVVLSIERLKSLYVGESTLITQDFVVEGVVTANDAYGEFPHCFVVEDNSGAIKVECDFDCATSGFIFGATVRIACGGLWIGGTGGVLSLGTAPEAQNPVGQISEAEALGCLRIVDKECGLPEPAIVTIGALTSYHLLRFVRITDLYRSPDDPLRSFCSRDPESGAPQNTTHTLRDLSGAEIDLEVSREVRYAADDLPDGLFSVCAIVEYFGGEYRLRITNCKY